MIAQKAVVLEQNNIIGLDVGTGTSPFLTFLQGLKEALLPMVPKFVRQVLNSAPSPVRV